MTPEKDRSDTQRDPSDDHLTALGERDDGIGNDIWLKEVNTYLGGRIRLRRKQLKMNQTKLGNLVGLTFQQVQKYEHGSNRIGAARLFDMARVLGVHPMFFVENCPQMHAEGPPGLHERQSEFGGASVSSEGEELMRLFSRLANPDLRAHVLAVVRALAGEVD